MEIIDKHKLIEDVALELVWMLFDHLALEKKKNK